LSTRNFVSINKSDVGTPCGGCPFYKDPELRKRAPILIPTPPKTNIVLISRDPTTDFMGIYDYARHLDEDQRRLALFSSGIPQQLVVQIGRFLRKKRAKERAEWLEETKTCYRLFQVAYWTHLHKCPTGNGKKFGKRCADTYLQAEIQNALSDGAATLVTLGRHAKEWIDKHESLTKDVEVISLPHPSPQNNRIWYRRGRTEAERKRKRNVESEIRKLAKTLENIQLGTISHVTRNKKSESPPSARRQTTRTFSMQTSTEKPWRLRT
jgi:uracil-DNA glycosylase